MRLAGGINGTAHLMALASDGLWQFSIVLNPDDEAGDFCDGDIVTLDVRDDITDEVVIVAQQTMTYSTSRPNGELCSPSCEEARLELAPI